MDTRHLTAPKHVPAGHPANSGRSHAHQLRNPGLALAISLLVLSGCTNTSRGGPPPTTASVVVSHTIPSSSATAHCVGTATWRLTPVSLTGDQGDSAAKSWTSPFDVGPGLDTQFGDTGHSCVITDIPGLALRAGKWRFDTVVGSYSGSCEIDLHVGRNSLGYHELSKCAAN